MFRGSFEHTLDDKGRLSIPAKFRDVLAGNGDERIVIAPTLSSTDKRCLDVYPFDAWHRLEARHLAATAKIRSATCRIFKTYYLEHRDASAAWIPMVGFLIPPGLA